MAQLSLLTAFLALTFVGVVVSSKIMDDDAAVDALSKRLLQILAGEELEKRGFYNVVRDKDSTRVYFQENSKCRKCPHTITYVNGKKGEKVVRSKQGDKMITLNDTDYNAGLELMVCEYEDDKCRFAYLPAGKKVTMFSSSSKQEPNDVNQIMRKPLRKEY